MRRDEVWKTDAVVRTFLTGVRAGIPMAAEQIDVMLRVIGARGMAVRRFADLGCGSGVLAQAILARHADAAATLVDFSEPMLRAARDQLGSCPGDVHFVAADFGAPHWVHAVEPRAPFDAIVSGYAIHHQPDARKRRLFAEIFDLLQPGGVFVNVEHVASVTPWVESISDDLFVDSLYASQVRQGTTRNRAQVADEFYRRPDKSANILAAVEAQCEWLRVCGFADVDCYFKVFELAVFGGRRPEGGWPEGEQPMRRPTVP